MKENNRRKIIYINDQKTKYMVTDEGDVYSLDYKHTGKAKKLKTHQDKDGYVIVTIYLNGKRYDRKMHRLVAEAFIPNPKNKPEVNHKNGKKSDNYKGNLEWMTTKENLNHAAMTGLNEISWNQTGESNNAAKYTDKVIKKVCKALESNKLTRKEISEKYDVGRGTIDQILKGAQWTHISDKYDLSKFDRYKSTPKPLDEAIVVKICKLLAKGELTMKEISEKVGVSKKRVYRIYKRETKVSISKDYDFSRVPKGN